MRTEAALMGPWRDSGVGRRAAWAQIAWSAALVGACAALAWLGQGSFAPEALWDPAAGLCVFFLMRMGLRYWPVILLALLSGIVVAGQQPRWMWVSAIAALAYALMASRLRERPAVDSLTALGSMALVVVTGTSLLCIVVGMWHWWSHSASVAAWAATLLHDWLAELNGVLIIVPLLSGWGTRRWRRPTASELMEAAAQAGAIALVLWAVFAIAVAYNVRFFSLLFLPLIWVVARWGFEGTTLALAAFQIGIVTGAQTSLGTSSLQLQLMTFALCVTGLIPGAFVTQRRRVQAQLDEKQAALTHALQLASAGEMTSALAHELSQPVAALSRYLGACGVLASDDRHREELKETLRKAMAEATRATDVVRRLRDFYRRGTVEISIVDPMTLVESALRSAQTRAQRADIRLFARSSDPLPRVAVDVLQVETALLNVLNNAIDALINWPGGREIEIRAGLSPKGVGLVVSDTGPGIDPSIAARLFEPFNTSKASGMGMGLAISRTLLTASGGDIALNDSGGTGTSFIITLPLFAPSKGASHG